MVWGIGLDTDLEQFAVRQVKGYFMRRLFGRHWQNKIKTQEIGDGRKDGGFKQKFVEGIYWWC